MRNVKYTGVALVATIAMCIVGVASAAALPEFKGTKIPDSFTSKNETGVEPVLASYITILGTEENIICTSSEDKGEIHSATTVTGVIVKYHGCREVSEPTKECSNKEPGEIETKSLSGTVGYLNKTTTPPLVGIELKPASGNFVEFTCKGKAEKVTVEGCTIGEATPVNAAPSVTGKLTFAKNGSAHEQQWTKFEGSATKCELKVKAGFFGLGSGPSWVLDKEVETFTTAVELKG